MTSERVSETAPASRARASMRAPRSVAVAVAFIGLVFAAGGCQRALFPADLPRTQFETYDKMRQRYVPLEEPDVFGTPQPALRARLGQQN